MNKMKPSSFTLGIFGMTLLALSININAQDAGFFLDDWQEKVAEFPDFEPISKSINTPSVTIHVDMKQVLQMVPDYIYGNNAVTWDNGLPANTTAMTDLKNLNTHVLRWPGGNLSNSYFWNAIYGERPNDIPADLNPWYGMKTQDWQMSVSEYYDLLAETNNTGIICVNYSYARYGTSADPVAAAAHLAADWVRFDNGRSKFWEIGNENFGKWQEGYKINLGNNQDGQPEYISGALYGQHCRIFIDSMRAAASEIGVDIKIGVVAYDAETSSDPIQTVWNEGMMAEVGDLADYLIVHSYFTPYNENSTVSTILNSYGVPGEIMSAMVSDMDEAGKPMIPVAMTEWNIFAIDSGQMVSYINGMLAALTLGEFIKSDYGLATRWDLVNGWSNGNDHGMFSTGDEPGVVLYNPRAVFFYMYYFQKYFGDRMLESSVNGNSSLVSYASSFSSGDCGMVIINKSNSAETVSVVIDNFDPGMNYYYHVLTGGTDNGSFSRKVLLNGIATNEGGGGPDEYETIKAFSSEIDGGITIDLPSLSVVYILVEKAAMEYIYSKVEDNPQIIDIELSVEVQSPGDPAGYELLANGSTPLTISSIETDAVDAHWIHLNLDQAVLATDVLTLSYSGNDAISLNGDLLNPFSSETVENLLVGAPPLANEVFTNAEGTEIHLIFSFDMQVSTTAFEDFTLEAEGDPNMRFGLSAIYVDAENPGLIVLSTSELLYAEYKLLLSYTGSDVKTTDLALLGSFDLLPVDNLSPGSPPEVISVEVSEYGMSVDILFSKGMNEISASGSGFIVTVDGQDRAISAIEISGVNMHILLDDFIQYGEVVTLSYEGSSATSTDRGILMEFSDLSVANNLQESTIIDIPGVIFAEMFSINFGMELEPCSDFGGGSNLGNIDAGDWVEYIVNVAQTGQYKGSVRVAVPSIPGELIIQTPDADLIDQMNVSLSATGGWQTWSSVPVEISLVKGIQRIRLYAETGNYNINFLSLDIFNSAEGETLMPEEMIIYPNPVDDQLIIESGESGISSVEIIDITGKLLIRNKYQSSPSKVSFTVNLPNGIYILRVKSVHGVNVSSLIVQ